MKIQGVKSKIAMDKNSVFAPSLPTIWQQWTLLDPEHWQQDSPVAFEYTIHNSIGSHCIRSKDAKTPQAPG